MYSIFNLFIGFVVGTYMLYMGYYGIGRPDSFSILKFKVCGIIVAVIWLYFAIVGSGAANGLMDLSTATGYWVFAVLIESVLFLCTGLLCSYSYYLIYKGKHQEGMYAGLVNAV